MQVYLDNAATTALDDEVITEMTHFMRTYFGNPSSTHLKGRETKVELEKARKKIAKLIGAREKEIIFTSGGTESNNAILKSLALSKTIERIISSPIEHHSILDTLNWIKANTNIEVVYLKVDSIGNHDLDELESLLKINCPTLVSLMHGNNEVGNLLDVKKVGKLCKVHNAFFHTDMVQTLGHFPLNLNELPIDFASASAHKTHGPKGNGFIYINSSTSKLETFSHGGAQERSIRGGTENIIGIIGMAKAYEIALKSLEKDRKHITKLKESTIKGLKKHVPKILFNGASSNLNASLYNVINIQFDSTLDETLLFNLDINGVFVSEGSACSSGASKGSHVLQAIDSKARLKNNIRISFSKKNTFDEVDYAIKVISEAVKKG